MVLRDAIQRFWLPYSSVGWLKGGGGWYERCNIACKLLNNNNYERISGTKDTLLSGKCETIEELSTACKIKLTFN